MKSNNLEPCSVCGTTHTELIDVIYPLNRERTKWNIYCNETMFGCGRIYDKRSAKNKADKIKGIINEK